MQLKIFDFDYYNHDLASQKIKDQLETVLKNKEGLWLYREPEIKTDGNDYPSFTIVSSDMGLVFVRVYDYTEEVLSCVDNKFWTINGQNVRSECIRFRNYVHKIVSKIEDPMVEFEEQIPIRTYYVFPYIENRVHFSNIGLKENEVLVCAQENIQLTPTSEVLKENDYKCLVSIIQNANIINKSTNIYVEEPAQNISEAIVLNDKRIALFDYDQMTASLTITADKSERIRGLAGSGKTVLLAMKAARLHKRFPDKKIAFVFYTKSLYNQATNLIRKYYNQIADDEPNWDNLLVLHSWGGQTVGNGFYYSVCKACGLPPKTLRQGTLADHCKELLESNMLKEIYDFVLIDEAQDFPLEFFLLVQRVAKFPKKVVVAYDELQTTNDIVIPEFEELFGETDGKPNIILEPQHDYILKKSYRNTLEVLITAFAFGFGFYKDLTQIIQDKTTWEALGFETDSVLEPGNRVTVHRPAKNSPNSVTSIYSKEMPVQHFILDNDETVALEASKKIKHLIVEENVKPTDILVIDIKMNKSNMLNKIQGYLMEEEIESHIPGVVTDAREFFQDDKVTLSTPRNAKGNEVPIVFVVGCEDIYSKLDMSHKRQSRNFMFISITRSKGWVYLYASGRVKTVFQKEFRDIEKNCPEMIFEYPSEETINTLAKIDFLTKNPKAKSYDSSIMAKIKQALASGDGEILKQLIELDPSLKDSLKALLGD